MAYTVWSWGLVCVYHSPSSLTHFIGVNWKLIVRILKLFDRSSPVPLKFHSITSPVYVTHVTRREIHRNFVIWDEILKIFQNFKISFVNEDIFGSRIFISILRLFIFWISSRFKFKVDLHLRFFPKDFQQTSFLYHVSTKISEIE